LFAPGRCNMGTCRQYLVLARSGSWRVGMSSSAVETRGAGRRGAKEAERNRLAARRGSLGLMSTPASRSVGSSPRLLRELEWVQTELRVPDGYAHPVDDPMGVVKAAYLQLPEDPAELPARIADYLLGLG